MHTITTYTKNVVAFNIIDTFNEVVSWLKKLF